MKSELIKYQIEYYDMINDNTDYMTVFAYDTAGAVRIFNCVYNEKYVPVSIESEDLTWMH